MAIHIQTKTNDFETAIDKLEKELALAKTSETEKNEEISEVKQEIEEKQRETEKLVGKIDSLSGIVKEMEAKNADLELALDQAQVSSEQKVAKAKEYAEEDLKILKSEHEIRIRDLTMQLEIANATKTEFEDMVESLKQEIKDAAEDRKIGDKKGQSLIKDLKKQLNAEKLRNEKLSEKIKEHFSTPSTISGIFMDLFTLSKHLVNDFFVRFCERGWNWQDLKFFLEHLFWSQRKFLRFPPQSRSNRLKLERTFAIPNSIRSRLPARLELHIKPSPNVNKVKTTIASRFVYVSIFSGLY